ncbi:uncharacterized protein G2W53_000844 [Senna tora]|uniref:Protein TILLER ANGLE CONTROL 1 n=1 Tax=Senna tora TaxID=362788 RepID=A0A834XES3_9FABA|nr:uncharacterized protein G2W53_000844 [Senna tora]
MKIFNWMHKAFHHTAMKDQQQRFASNSNMKKKTELPKVIIGESEALFQEVALAGILTIGTLGYYDTLNPFNSQHKELSPLMHTTFEHNFEQAMEVMTLMTPPPVVSHEITEELVGAGTDDDSKKKKKGERITLADLFLADSDDEMVVRQQQDTNNTAKKLSLKVKAKHGLPTFAKKLIPKDKPHPIKNIRKMMKKMIKKKIHPEIDVMDEKLDESGMSENQKIEANDSISLLPV